MCLAMTHVFLANHDLKDKLEKKKKLSAYSHKGINAEFFYVKSEWRKPQRRCPSSKYYFLAIVSNRAVSTMISPAIKHSVSLPVSESVVTSYQYVN